MKPRIFLVLGFTSVVDVGDRSNNFLLLLRGSHDDRRRIVPPSPRRRGQRRGIDGEGETEHVVELGTAVASEGGGGRPRVGGEVVDEGDPLPGGVEGEADGPPQLRAEYVLVEAVHVAEGDRGRIRRRLKWNLKKKKKKKQSDKNQRNQIR